MSTQFDLDNERAIVVSALKDEDARRMAVGSVQPEDFLGERFQTIFTAIRECHRRDLIPDADAIAVHSDGGDFGGIDFIKRLLTFDVAKNLEYHLTRLKRDAGREEIRRIVLPEFESMLSDRTVEHGECLVKANEIQQLLRTDSTSRTDSAKEWGENLDKRCSGEIHFQSVGYPMLDKMLAYGFGVGQVSVIAGRTSNGKTTLVADMIRRLLGHDVKPKICVLPNEIGKERFIDKLVSSATLVPSHKFAKDAQELTLAEREDLKKTATKLVGVDDRLTVFDNPFVKLPIWTNDTALDKIEELLAEGGYGLLVMDLFQRCLVDTRPGAIEQALVRAQHMAQTYKTHLCLLHQISRKAEERKGKRPELSDLKGSGGYEEIPDVVMLLHRPKAYKHFRRKDELEITIAKQRDGESNITAIGEFYPTVSRVENVVMADRSGRKEDESNTSSASFTNNESVY